MVGKYAKKYLGKKLGRLFEFIIDKFIILKNFAYVFQPISARGRPISFRIQTTHPQTKNVAYPQGKTALIRPKTKPSSQLQILLNGFPSIPSPPKQQTHKPLHLSPMPLKHLLPRPSNNSDVPRPKLPYWPWCPPRPFLPTTKHNNCGFRSSGVRKQ